jgi:alginate O-acetyltransferase complex protein AlgI
MAASYSIDDIAVAATGAVGTSAAFGLAACAASAAWIRMYCIAFGMLVALKWVTWVIRPAGVKSNATASAAYLLAWPGMDIRRFMARDMAPGDRQEWRRAVIEVLGGVAMIWLLAPLVRPASIWLYAAIGVAGLLSLVHFGLFRLASLALRRAGFGAAPTMNRPFAAVSLSELWGQRWNRPFRDVAHRFIFRPLAVRLGVRAGALAVFLFSGLVHDLVISLPAGAGYGLPTIYFMIQYAGIEIERSPLADRLRLHEPRRGWVYTFAVAVLPIPLLFHSPFLNAVIVPFMEAIGAGANLQ